MRFMPMGRPIRPIPINPIFVGRTAGFKRGLLGGRERAAPMYSAQNEEKIVAELQGRKCGGGALRISGGFGAVGEREDAGGAPGRSGGSERLVVRVGHGRRFGRGFGSVGYGDSGCRSAGVRFFFDAHQILVRDFPAEVLVLSALLEILFEEDGTAGIGDESAGGRQKDIAGAILHLNSTPEKGGEASHPLPSFRIG